MPYQLSRFDLPCGVPCGRVEWSGVATEEEAAAVVAQRGPGGQLDGLGLLVLSQNQVGMTSEARRLFSTSSDSGWVAIVATSPLMRVSSNFILRTAKNPKRRMFATEAEAIEWLDARHREDAAAR